jgi:aconitase B
MPAQSKAQQRAAGAALAAKRGEVDPKTLESASRDMYDSMTEQELEELASTKLDGLPEHKG